MAVTRIKNNQIYEQTITYNKLVPGTLVGTVFNPNVTLNSNIIINGNLSVSGVTTTVSSTNTLIADPLVIFNNGYSGADAYDVGMLVNRGTPTDGKNAAWIWRQANVGFAGVLTNETGTTTGSINNYTYANLIIGNTIIDSQYAVDSTSTSSGAFQVRGGASVSGNLNIGSVGSSFGAQTGLVTIDGNVGIVQITQAASTRYGLMVTDTNNNGTLAFRTGTAWGAQIHTFAGTNRDIYLQPDRKPSIWLPAGNAAVVIQNNINSTNANVGAVIIAGSGGLAVGGNLNVGTAATFESGRILLTSPATQTNTIIITGNISGTSYTGTASNVTVLGSGIGQTSIGARSTIVGSQAGNVSPATDNTLIGYMAGGQISGTNNQFFGTFAGNAVTTGNYNVILGSYDGNVIASLSNQVVISDGQARPRIRIDAAGNTYVVSGVDSTSSNIGAFVVQGGVGIGANLNVGGAMAIASSRLILDATQTSIVMAANTATTYLSTDSVIIGQKIGSGTNFGAKATVIGSEAAKTNTNASEVTLYGYRAGYSGLGALSTAIGSQAGLNATGTNNQFFGYAAGSASSFTGSYNVILGSNTGSSIASLSNYVIISDGQGNERIRATNTGSVYIPANITSTSTSVGSLVVQGGLATAGLDNNFLGNVTIGGNLWVLGGTTAIQSNITVIEDSTLQLHTFGSGTALNANDLKDIGIVTRYYKTNDRLAFFGWQNTTSNFVYIDDATETTANVVTGTYGNVQFGSALLSNSTVSTGTTSGALIVTGGAGIGGRLSTGSITNDGNFTSSGTGAVITIQPTGGSSTIAIGSSSQATTGAINNMDVGVTTPATAYFKDIFVVTSTTPQGRNATFSGNGYVYIQPTGTVTIAPTATGNMDNVYIGNTTPRQGYFTAVHVGQDLRLSAFSANSALFISQTAGNLSVDQKNEAFNFQRTTSNTFSTVALGVGHLSQNNLLTQGTDTLNLHYQGDSFALYSETAANTLSQSAGWTVSTARGTATAPAVSQDGDFIGLFGSYAWSGSAPQYYETASWRYVAQGTNAATSGIGGQAQLWTKRDNGASTLAMRVDANQIATFYGQVVVANTSTTTNSTNGAFYVVGGHSVGGNLIVGQSARFNDTQNANRDFYVRGQNDATLIWASTGTYNQVVIGNSAASGDLVTGAKLQINSTDSMLLPIGVTGQRPGLGGYGSAAEGMLRYNTTKHDIEFYTGNPSIGDAGWFSPQSGSLTIFQDFQYNGDNSTVEFSTGVSTTGNGCFVSINGVIQLPSLAYDVFQANTTLRFTEAPAVGDVIDIRVVTTAQTISGLASTNGFVSVTAENTGLRIAASGVEPNKTVFNIETTNGYVQRYPLANTSVGTSPTVVASFSATAFRSGKFIVQVVGPSGASFETSEVLVIHDGATATRTQYSRIYTGAAPLGSVTATYSGGTVSMYYTGANTGNYVKVMGDLVAI